MKPLQAPPWSEPLAHLVADRLGLHFPAERMSDLVRGVGAASREFGFADSEACARWLIASTLLPEQLATLAAHLTVGETYFFRDNRAFELIETEVIPELVRRRGAGTRLRFWSAGCCTGEEAYSLAIASARATGSPQFANVLGTDLNRQFLRVAAAGIFGAWSFRDTPPGIRQAYFSSVDGPRWRIDAAIRSSVTFRPLNLAADLYPSTSNGTHALDLILCRNVLIYFSPARATEVIRLLARCLAVGGWLIVGPTEAAHVDCADLEAIRRGDAVFYRRREAAAPPSPPPAQLSTSVLAPTAPIVVRPAQLPDPQTTVAEQPKDPLKAAREFADQGRLDQALASCDEMLRQSRTSHQAHHLRAEILQELGRASEAAEAFRRALYLQPDYVPTHFALAHLEFARGRRREARRHLANTLALLRNRPADEVIPDTGGLTSGRIVEIVSVLQAAAPAHA